MKFKWFGQISLNFALSLEFSILNMTFMYLNFGMKK